MKATNIVWDVDIQDIVERIGNMTTEDRNRAMGLPTEIEIPEGMTDTDEISDYISDKTGFCHAGFKLID